jgi:hypothetical protein
LCPGVFIAILALVAAAVTFREKVGPREKALWIFCFFALMCGEVWMLGIDRNRNEDEQAKANALSLSGFKDIGEGIQKSISESDKNFNATMNSTERLRELSAHIRKGENNANENASKQQEIRDKLTALLYWNRAGGQPFRAAPE